MLKIKISLRFPFFKKIRHSASLSFRLAFLLESYSSRGNREHLAHGRQLKIYLAKNAEKLEFFPPGAQRSSILWEKGRVRSETGWSWREAQSCFQLCCISYITTCLFCHLQDDQRQSFWHRQ